MAIDYSQYSGLAMPDVMKKAGFMFGAPPTGWDWGAYQAATGVNPNAVTAGGKSFDAGANDNLWNIATRAPGTTSAPPVPANPLARAGSVVIGGPSAFSAGPQAKVAHPMVNYTTMADPANPAARGTVNIQGPGNPPPPPPPPAAGPGSNPLARGPVNVQGPGSGTPGTGTWPYPGNGSTTATPAPFNVNDPNTFGSTNQFVIDPRLQSAFSTLLQQALARYNDPNGMSYFPGQITPGLTTDGSAAQQLLRQFAAGMGGTNNATQQFYQSILGQGTGPNAGQSPALDAAVQAMRNSATQQFTNPGGPLSQIRTAAGQAGQQGGTRQGIAEGVAAGQEATGMDNAEAQMRYQSLQDSYSNALKAMGLLPQVTTAGMAPGMALSSIDAQNRDIQLGQNTDAFNAWAYNNTIQDTRLSNLMNLINGSMPLGGTQYSQQFYPGWYTALMQSQGTASPNTGNQILGGVAGAAGLYQLYQSLFGH